jgi:ADP-ribose pyrophosphatase YjhB (NUDIX family)
MGTKKIVWDYFDNGIFLVNTLGIIFDTKTRKILIGKREKDPFIKNLGWCFPGGTPDYGKDLEEAFEMVVKKKTGLKVKNLGSIFSRIPNENEKFLLIYYLCEVVGGKEKPGEGFKKLKWVKPTELQKYFTTSFDKRLKEYILGLK